MDTHGSVRCESLRNGFLSLRNQSIRSHPYLAAEFQYFDHVPYQCRSLEIWDFYFGEFQLYRQLGDCYTSFLARHRALSKRSLRVQLIVLEANTVRLICFCHTGASLVTVIYWTIAHPDD
jgi:hypothetical protein